ncbi:MAG: hypothetical protein ACJ75H_13490 [Thermoanaerobaculia bacterium]
MELDALKQSWQDHDRKLDANLRLNTVRLYNVTLGKAETALRRLSRLLKVELFFHILILIGLGSFLADHITQPRFLIPGLVLHLFVLLLAIDGGRQVVAIGSLDIGHPIVEIQKRMESLRLQRLRALRRVLLFSPLIWIPLLIVALKGLLGVDAYAIFDPVWLAANILFGLAVIPLAVWISRRYADRMQRSPLAQRLLRDLAGYNLNAATAYLGTLERFEREGTA